MPRSSGCCRAGRGAGRRPHSRQPVGRCVLSPGWSSPQVYARMLRLTLADPAHSDFTIFYYTVRLVRRRPADVRRLSGALRRPRGRPTTSAISTRRTSSCWCASGAALSYERASAVWIGVSARGTGLLGRRDRARTLQIADDPAAVRRLAAPLIISSAPFTTVAVTSELTFLLMLPFTLRGLRRGAGSGGRPVCGSASVSASSCSSCCSSRGCSCAAAGRRSLASVAAASAAVAVGMLAFGAGRVPGTGCVARSGGLVVAADERVMARVRSRDPFKARSSRSR